jgi:hypothetical protein
LSIATTHPSKIIVEFQHTAVELLNIYLYKLALDHENLLSSQQTRPVWHVYPAAGFKTSFQIYIDVTVATAHPTKILVEFQHNPISNLVSNGPQNCTIMHWNFTNHFLRLLLFCGISTEAKNDTLSLILVLKRY